MSARDVARQVLRRVEQGEAYASLALDGALGKAKLSDQDRGLATELVYGVLRHRSRLDRALAAHAARGIGGVSRPILVALRVAAYQLLELRVPAHAAVDDGVAAVRALGGQRMSGFANALLRKLAQAGEPPPPAGLRQRLVEVHSLPDWIAARVIAALGDEAEAAAAAMNRPPPLALRVSVDRAETAAIAARISEERPGAAVVASPHLAEALLVRGAGAPEALAPFREGLVTVQDLAAQLVGRMAGIRPGERVLDACAGVGGKSTHLAQLARAAGGPARIDMADLSARKLDLAVDTARRLGVAADLRPLAGDLLADGKLEASYDRVVVDAPCSGLGVLRRHPEGKWRRQEAEIAEVAALQARLLARVAPRVRPGGVLVYAVCTFTDEEGPAQIARFLAENPGFRREAPVSAPGVDFAPFLDGDALRTWPHRHDADGFYAARLLRVG